jgi:mono/diheme cytochrome c family protein
MKIKIIIGLAILVATIAACQSDDQLEFKHYYASGSVVFQTHCQNCHGQHGEGLQGLIPPLTDSLYLKINKNLLACSIKYGLKGKIDISNKTFDGAMPANDLAPVEIAEVLTYVTNSFGNKLGTITSEKVDQDLAKCQ